MRHTMSRQLVVILSVLALVLGACGSEEGGDTTTSLTTDTSTAETTPPADTAPDTTAAPDTSLAGEAVSVEIAANAVRGGKNDAEAVWIEDYVIPEFEAMMEEAGRDVTVSFNGRGVDDEDFKAQLALDLQSGSGADLMSIDGIWVGEFVEAGYILPLTEAVGPEVEEWEGWDQIPDAVQQNMSYLDQRYGIPTGTDGRVLYFNKDLFEQAGLPTDWQPTSWEEILETARTLQQELPDVKPLQINAGTAMGEATTMQGYLPLLVGTGERVYDEEAGTWVGATPGNQAVLELYETIFAEELADPDLQLRQDGRDRSFQEFAEGGIAVLAEGDYFWRSVIHPVDGIAPMENRDEVVGWAMIPAREPGAGINGQDFVSMSGGGGRIINPNSANPDVAWELLTFMNSREAVLEFLAGQARISQRMDVNEEVLADDPLLSSVAEEVLPLTAYRPGLAVYPQVSVLLQEASEAVVTGTSAADAAQQYQSELEGLVGADAVEGG